MSNPFYTNTINAVPFTLITSTSVNAQFQSVQSGFDAVYAVTTTINLTLPTLAPLASPVFTGNPTGPTMPVGDSSLALATTAFVAAQAFTAALPGQAGKAGLEVTTNGSAASWGVTAPGALAVLNYIGY